MRMSLWISFPLNLGVAYVFARPESWVGQVLELPQSVDPLYAGFSAFMVALFGFVYAWLALQANLRQPLLVVGAIGKTGVFFLVAALWLTGSVSTPVVGLASIDLVLALCWIFWMLLAPASNTMSAERQD
jgi:hypothetical protein